MECLKTDILKLAQNKSKLPNLLMVLHSVIVLLRGDTNKVGIHVTLRWPVKEEFWQLKAKSKITNSTESV